MKDLDRDGDGWGWASLGVEDDVFRQDPRYHPYKLGLVFVFLQTEFIVATKKEVPGSITAPYAITGIISH